MKKIFKHLSVIILGIVGVHNTQAMELYKLRCLKQGSLQSLQEFYKIDAIQQLVNYSKINYKPWGCCYHIENHSELREASFIKSQPCSTLLLQNTSNDSLVLASKMGNIEIIKILIEHGADVNHRAGLRGNTPLHSACKQENPAVVLLLLEHGADPNKANLLEETPIVNAIKRGYVEIIKVLLKHNANIHSTDSGGKTLLHCAAGQYKLANVNSIFKSSSEMRKITKKAAVYSRHLASTALLLSHGANCDINKTDNYGRTPLYYAYARGNKDIIDLLLEYGATPFSDKDIAELLIYIKNIDGVELLKSLLENSNEEFKAKLLIIAAKQSFLKLIRCLLDLQVNVNTTDADGQTPLHLAIRNRNLGIITLLLDHECEINKANKFGQTPLKMAICSNQLEIVKKLLEKGAEVNNANSFNGWTPLHTASFLGHVAIVKELLQKGAHSNVSNKNGWTALHVVSASTKASALGIFKQLIENGTDLNIPTTTHPHLTPSSIAESRGNVFIKNYCLEIRLQKEHRNLPAGECTICLEKLDLTSDGYYDLTKVAVLPCCKTYIRDARPNAMHLNCYGITQAQFGKCPLCRTKLEPLK